MRLRIYIQLGNSWQVWQGHAHGLGLLCCCLNAPETVLPDSPGSSSPLQRCFFSLSFGWQLCAESSRLNVGEGKQIVLLIKVHKIKPPFVAQEKKQPENDLPLWTRAPYSLNGGRTSATVSLRSRAVSEQI